MKAILLLLSAVFAHQAIATCTTPATGTLEDMMAQATWTTETGSNWPPVDRTAQVTIALPALNVNGHDCLTWSVELVLPPGVVMADDAEGNPKPASKTGLATSASATFDVVVAPRLHDHHVQYLRGWLRVKVRNPSDDPGKVLHRASGSPLWLYPVSFKQGSD